MIKVIFLCKYKPDVFHQRNSRKLYTWRVDIAWLFVYVDLCIKFLIGRNVQNRRFFVHMKIQTHFPLYQQVCFVPSTCKRKALHQLKIIWFRYPLFHLCVKTLLVPSFRRVSKKVIHLNLNTAFYPQLQAIIFSRFPGDNVTLVEHSF